MNSTIRLGTTALLQSAMIPTGIIYLWPENSPPTRLLAREFKRRGVKIVTYLPTSGVEAEAAQNLIGDTRRKRTSGRGSQFRPTTEDVLIYVEPGGKFTVASLVTIEDLRLLKAKYA